MSRNKQEYKVLNKPEELTTIGQLRDQCVQMTAMVEQYQLGGD